MPSPSVPTDSFTSIGQEWLAAIPPVSLADVLQYVADTWQDLVEKWPTNHCFSRSEPKLSLSLGQRLNELPRKREAGISGFFGAEALEPVRVEGEVHQNGRTDIKFVFGGYGAPEFILECKKLDGTATMRASYCSEGIARFVTGKYASEYYQGAMVAFTKVDVAGEAGALKVLLESAPSVVNYRCLAFPQGGFVREPSALAPGLAFFDTQHERTPSHASPFDLAHLLLSAPVAAPV
jgi:hypothetical protein